MYNKLITTSSSMNLPFTTIGSHMYISNMPSKPSISNQQILGHKFTFKQKKYDFKKAKKIACIILSSYGEIQTQLKLLK